MKAIVTVTLKNGVLDPAGKAVEQGLHSLGFDEVGSVRLGKTVEIELGEVADLQKRVADMCQQLLANTVIEDFEIEII